MQNIEAYIEENLPDKAKHKEIAWSHLVHCGSGGSCGGGRKKNF